MLFGFFIMGFCDVVGIATSYVQQDFGLSETEAGLIPSMVFIWFLLLSLPAALLMNRVGRKVTVLISNVVTAAGMILPFIHYDMVMSMTAFVLLGIGNTMLQVSLNPLLSNIVEGSALASSLTAGQVVKAVSSFCGPLIASFAVVYFGSWQYLFPVFALLTIISTVWLRLTYIAEEPVEKGSSLRDSLSLLRDRRILLLFLGIFFVVGTDVGINTVAPKLLMERCGFAVEDAGFCSSVYFVCRTAGAFVGTIALTRINPVVYMRINAAAAVAVVLMLMFAADTPLIMIGVGLAGFFCSSIFSIIYSEALEIRPGKENELSGLMIMGIFGGAVIPPVMGIFADMLGGQSGSLLVIAASLVYLVYCSMALPRRIPAEKS